MSEVTTRTRTVVDETDASGLRPDYNVELRETLDKMREEMDDRIRQTHDETEAFYERKVWYPDLGFNA